MSVCSGCFPFLFVILSSVIMGLVGAVCIDVVLGFDFAFRRPLGV